LKNTIKKIREVEPGISGLSIRETAFRF